MPIVGYLLCILLGCPCDYIVTMSPAQSIVFGYFMFNFFLNIHFQLSLHFDFPATQTLGIAPRFTRLRVRSWPKPTAGFLRPEHQVYWYCTRRASSLTWAALFYMKKGACLCTETCKRWAVVETDGVEPSNKEMSLTSACHLHMVRFRTIAFIRAEVPSSAHL